jgi:hypothetical protein
VYLRYAWQHQVPFNPFDLEVRDDGVQRLPVHMHTPCVVYPRIPQFLQSKLPISPLTHGLHSYNCNT